MAREIPLTRGYVAVVDDEDYERVAAWRWRALVDEQHATPRARAWMNSLGRNVYLHRFLLNPPSHLVVDHVNGNALDNRRVNLRVCTAGQNQWNTGSRPGATSQFKGVAWQQGKWLSRIRANGRSIYLGLFDDPVAAAHAYDIAAEQHHGRFARFNFPRPNQGAA